VRNRNLQTLTGCALLIVVCLFGRQVSLNAANRQVGDHPNLIVIMVDDMGYAGVSCFGNPYFKTPQIDRLAKEGMKFTDFHSSGTVCSPTRAGLLTGRYQQRAGIEAVIHAGALHKPDIARFPRQAFIDTNVTGTLNLLEAAVAVEHDRFVMTSTTSLMISQAIRDEASPEAAWLDQDHGPLAPRNI